LENILLFGGGVTAGTASGRQLARAAATAAARAAPGVAGRAAGTAGLIARRHPVASVVALGYVAHRMGLGPIETAEFIAEELAEPAIGMRGRIGLHGATPPDPVKLKKRKVSKANKAVKHAMNMLRAGSKGATGAAKGSLPKGAWSMATKAAGLANPKTKSKIGKGTSKLKRLARTLKRWW